MNVGKAGKLRTLLLPVVLLILLGGWLRASHPEFSGYLKFDEADYAMSLRNGFLAEYLGLKESSGFRFIHGIVKDYREGREPHPWRDAYLAGDAAAYRHMHPPVGLYPASLLSGWGIRQETVLRGVPAVLGLLACLAAALLALELCAAMSPGPRALAAALAAGLTAFSAYQIHISDNLSYHAAFVLACVSFLIACTRAARLGSVRAWYVSCAILGACVLTLEYWVLLGPAWLASLWIANRAEGGGWPALARRFGIGVLWLIASVTALWPPYIWAGAFLKPFVIFGALMVHPLPPSDFVRPWLLELALSHRTLAASLVAGAALGFRLLPKGFWKQALPILLYAGAFLLVNLRVGHMKPLYAGHMVPIYAVLAACGLAAALGRFPLPVGAAATAVLLAFPLAGAARHTPEAKEWKGDMAALKTLSSGKSILALSNGPVYKYYLEDAKVFLPPSSKEEELRFDSLMTRGGLDWVLAQRPTAEPGDPKKVDLRGRYVALPPLPLGGEFVHIWEKRPPAQSAADAGAGMPAPETAGPSGAAPSAGPSAR